MDRRPPCREVRIERKVDFLAIYGEYDQVDQGSLICIMRSAHLRNNVAASDSETMVKGDQFSLGHFFCLKFALLQLSAIRSPQFFFLRRCQRCHFGRHLATSPANCVENLTVFNRYWDVNECMSSLSMNLQKLETTWRHVTASQHRQFPVKVSPSSVSSSSFWKIFKNKKSPATFIATLKFFFLWAANLHGLICIRLLSVFVTGRRRIQFIAPHLHIGGNTCCAPSSSFAYLRVTSISLQFRENIPIPGLICIFD